MLAGRHCPFTLQEHPGQLMLMMLALGRPAHWLAATSSAAALHICALQQRPELLMLMMLVLGVHAHLQLAATSRAADADDARRA